jgi:hypothetical protein
MRWIALILCFTVLTGAAQTTSPAEPTSAPSKSGTQSTITVPAGTRVRLELVSPVMAVSAKVGQDIYAQVAFPIAINNQIALPRGTAVQGQIDALQLPGIFTFRATFQIHFTRIIFANGYTINLPQAPKAGSTSQSTDVYTAVATPYVVATRANDVLLDNGAPIEMDLQLPIRIDAAAVADVARQFAPTPASRFKSATQCQPVAGTPGTPDTVFPGNPGTPGTPDTVIPGVNGMPDTVIPGIPATPPTPDTVIPGTPGTPEITCTSPEITSNPKPQTHKQSFQIAATMLVAGKPLAPGTYDAVWKGTGPSVQVDIVQNGKTLMSVPARFALLNQKSGAAAQRTRNNPDGSILLIALRFESQSFALYFDRSGS